MNKNKNYLVWRTRDIFHTYGGQVQKQELKPKYFQGAINLRFPCTLLFIHYLGRSRSQKRGGWAEHQGGRPRESSPWVPTSREGDGSCAQKHAPRECIWQGGPVRKGQVGLSHMQKKHNLKIINTIFCTFFKL